MREFLEPVDLRIRRFVAQQNALAATINAWVATYGAKGHIEMLDQRLGFRLIFDGSETEPPLTEWALLIGECAHNMRSTLDNLAFALCRLKRDPPANPKKTSFPIFADAAQFADKGRGDISQMPIDAAKLVEEVQPFQRVPALGNGSPD